MANSRKGQSSIENIAMVSSFMVIMIPLIVFVFSVSATHNSDFYQRQLYEDTDVLKRNIEEAYAFCPSERSISIYYPTIVDNITFAKAGEATESERAMIMTSYTLDGNKYSFSTPVNTVNNNYDDYPGGISIPQAPGGTTNEIIKGGIVKIKINCTVMDSGLPSQSIRLRIEDARGG
jgi:hypothetical protein